MSDECSVGFSLFFLLTRLSKLMQSWEFFLFHFVWTKLLPLLLRQLQTIKKSALNRCNYAERFSFLFSSVGLLCNLLRKYINLLTIEARKLILSSSECSSERKNRGQLPVCKYFHPILLVLRVCGASNWIERSFTLPERAHSHTVIEFRVEILCCAKPELCTICEAFRWGFSDG